MAVLYLNDVNGRVLSSMRASGSEGAAIRSEHSPNRLPRTRHFSTAEFSVTLFGLRLGENGVGIGDRH